MGVLAAQFGGLERLELDPCRVGVVGFSAAAARLRSCQLTNRMAALIRCTTQTPAVNLGVVGMIPSSGMPKYGGVLAAVKAKP